MERRVRPVVRPQMGQTYRRPTKRRVLPKISWSGWQGRALLAIVVLAAIGVLVSNAFAIKTIVVKPTTRQEQVTAEAKTAMAKWGQGNLLTLNSGRLVHDLLVADPAISQVTVGRSWSHTLILNITDKVASIGWQTGSTTYVLDAGGSVIGPAPSGSKLIIVHDDTNLPTKPGAHVAPSGFVTFCQDLSAQLNPITGLQVAALDIHETTIDLYVKTNKGYTVIFDTTRPLGEQLSDLKATLASLATQKKTPTQYIDIRTSGRAYYQ